MSEANTSLVLQQRIERCILLVRGHKVMLDADLADLYGVTTKRLNEQVKRNLARFPPDFMFQLTAEEATTLRSQIATSNGRGGRRYAPYVFTEHGAIMAANVLNSERAVEVCIYVVRTFIALRQYAASHQVFARRLAEMEKKYDHQFKVVFDAIRQMMVPPKKPAKIGFTPR
jgi:hypothetical protein